MASFPTTVADKRRLRCCCPTATRSIRVIWTTAATALGSIRIRSPAPVRAGRRTAGARATAHYRTAAVAASAQAYVRPNDSLDKGQARDGR